MKTLLLLRHAKSSWDDESLPDHDRPLNRRGEKASVRMGRLIRERKLSPDLILCSTAVRAKETLRIVGKKLKNEIPTEFLPELYHCSTDTFITTLAAIHKDADRVMLVGHNPGLEEFLSKVTGQNDLMPTAALAEIDLEISAWSDFDETTQGKLVHLWRPKELDD